MFLFGLLIIFSISLLFPGNLQQAWERIKLAVTTGRLEIGNIAPVVNDIYINESRCTSTASDCTVQGLENTSVIIVVEANVTDLNGDCDTFSTQCYAMLCPGAGVCNQDTYTHLISLSFDPGTQHGPTGTENCNLTGTITCPETSPYGSCVWFFEQVDDWGVNVTVSDGALYGDLKQSWKNNEIIGFIFPRNGGGEIDLGSLVFGWNEGAGQNLTQNSGNRPLKHGWNTTNFTHEFAPPPPPPDEYVIDIDGANFIVDDDNQYPGTDLESCTGPGSCAYIPADPENKVQFHPSGGLVPCSNPLCSAPTDATMDVFWHIDIPTGKQGGVYLNKIEVNGTYP